MAKEKPRGCRRRKDGTIVLELTDREAAIVADGLDILSPGTKAARFAACEISAELRGAINFCGWAAGWAGVRRVRT